MRQFNQSASAGLRIIIVGCGKVGVTLIDQLSKEGHDITILDRNPEKIQEISSLYDVLGIVGNGASYSVQKEAGVDKADLIIAVTESDELNLLCCTIARRVGNCAAIARVRTPDYSKEVGYLREKLGLAMIINPELEAAKEAVRILYLPTALEVNSFAHGQAELVKFKIPEDDNVLHDKAIAQLDRSITDHILICAVERDGDVHIPSGNFRLASGDILYFVATRKDGRDFLKRIGFQTKQVKNCLIIGGGKSTYYLASLLISNGIFVKIIENNPAQCELLSVLLPKAVIINGDGTNQELLKEAGIQDAEAVVPLTGIDEENIMLTLFAKQVSHAKVITKINRITFTNVIDNLDLGSVIYPKYIASEAIIAYVRARKAASKDSNIETLYHMFNSQVEAIEFHVSQNSAATDIPLMDLKLKKHLLVAFIGRMGSIIIPTGKDCIRKGDNVMIVTTHSGFKDILDILD